jgi:hypothetical protein
MGMIIEFHALPAAAAEDVEETGVLISSLSVNSLAVAEFFGAIASTELAPLIGDGADGSKELRLSLVLQAALMGQLQTWAYSASELLQQAFEVVEEVVGELRWRRGELVVIAR